MLEFLQRCERTHIHSNVNMNKRMFMCIQRFVNTIWEISENMFQDNTYKVRVKKEAFSLWLGHARQTID